MQNPPGGAPPGHPRPGFAPGPGFIGPPGQAGGPPNGVAPGIMGGMPPPGGGMPLMRPPGNFPMGGAPGALPPPMGGMPPAMVPPGMMPPGMMPGPGMAPPPGGAPPPMPGAPISAFQRISLSGQPPQGSFPPPPGPPGPPGGPPQMARPLPGPPGGGPLQHQMPSGGVPLSMGSFVSPPSQSSGALAGIPPPGPPGGLAASGPPHGPPGSMSAMPGRPMGPPGQGMMPPPGPPGMVPPPPLGMGQQGPPGQHGGYMQQPGPPGPPGQPPAPQAAPQRSGAGGNSRIDPTQIPRPVAQPVSSEPLVFDTRVAGAHCIPPPASARFVVRDRGSCSPRYMRATLNHVPVSNDLLNSTSMPLAVVVSPLALPDPGDEPVQVVDTSEIGPVRCVRCRAYMNPWVRWTSSGRRYTCNFCSMDNQTPDHYFCHLGPDGRRRDADERPELCKGTVEYLAPREYMTRSPQVPAHVFLIDVSQAAMATGVSASLCRAVSAALDGIQGGDRAMVGLATFDNTIHFYSVRSPTAAPQMLVVSDVNDVYAPSSARLLMPLAEVKEQLQELLERIPEMWAGSRINDNCGGAAIEAAVDLLKPCGGKVHALLSGLPSVGMHALKTRDGLSVGDKEKLAYLQSQDNTIKSLAASAAEHMVCVDVSFLSQSYCDVASLSDLASTTGGTCYAYMPYNPQMDFDQLVNDLRWNVARLQGLEAVMRVRCSTGLDVEHYTGHCFRPSGTSDVYLPAVDCDKALLAKLVLLEKLTPGAEAFLQAALLYTSTTGQRLIRVHTLALPLSDNVSTIFKGADLDAQISSLGRRLAAALPSQNLAACRELVTNSTVGTLYAYRKFCASSSSAVQLILPEALKLLPLFALSLLKSNGLKDSVKPDDRALWISHMTCLPCARIAPLLYPRLLPLTGLLERATPGAQPPDGNTMEGMTLSSEHLEQGGVYLLENGQEALLYMERAIAPPLLSDLIGLPSYDDLLRQPHAVVLKPTGGPANEFLLGLINKVRLQRSSYMRLRVARKGDPAEVAFFNLLVEDRSTAGMSYVEYLCQVHRLIQNKMA